MEISKLDCVQRKTVIDSLIFYEETEPRVNNLLLRDLVSECTLEIMKYLLSGDLAIIKCLEERAIEPKYKELLAYQLEEKSLLDYLKITII